MVPAHPVVMQPVHIHSVPVHPAPPILVKETWTTPGELLPLPKHTSRRQRSEPEPFDAYDYPTQQSKLKHHSRTYDEHRARLEQPLHPKKAIEYQDYDQEADEHAYYSDDAAGIFTGTESSSDRLDDNDKERKKPTSSPRGHTKGESSGLGYIGDWVESLPGAADEEPKGSLVKPAGSRRKPTTKKSKSTQRVHTNNDSRKLRDAQEYVGPQPDGADKQAKGSSAKPAGTERKHTTKKSTSSQRVHTNGDSIDQGHSQTYIESQPDAADKQAKESSTNPAGTEPKRTTKNLSSTTHVKADSKRRPQKPDDQTEERTSTNATDTGRAHTTANSSSNRSSIMPRESQSGVKSTTNKLEGSSNPKYDPKRGEFGIPTSVEKSTGHHSKEKAKGSSRVSQSKKPAKEELPWHMRYRNAKDEKTVLR